MRHDNQSSGSSSTSESNPPPPPMHACGAHEDWVDAWEEFLVAFAKDFLDLTKLNKPARCKLRAAFGASVGKQAKKGQWKDNQGNHSPYAKFVVNTCAHDLAGKLKNVPGMITVADLRTIAIDLTNDKWMDECPTPIPGTPRAETAAPQETLGESCRDLLIFLGEAADMLNQPR